MKRYYTYLTTFLLVFLTIVSLQAQDNSVAIGSNTVKNNAVLWLNGNGSQGLLLPSVGNTSNVSGPDAGMVVYQTSDNRVYYFDGSTWVGVGGNTGGGGDTYALRLQGTNLELLANGAVQDQVALTSFTVGGDITGNIQNASVVSLNGIALPNGTPNTNQILVYNGTSWSYQDIPTGTFTGVVTDATLTGDGTAGAPLSVASLDDADADPTNENQDLSLAGTTLNISNGTGVDLAPIIPPGGTDDQTAAEVSYDNSTSGLGATDVKGALDELALAGGGSGDITDVIAGTGLSGGGTTGSVTLNLADVGTPGTYTKVTTDAQGRVTTGASLVAADIPNLTLAKITDAGSLAGLNAVDGATITDLAITDADISNTAGINIQKLDFSGTSEGDILQIVGGVPTWSAVGGSNDAQSLQGTPIDAGLAPASGQVLKWDGAQWVAGLDDTGAGGAPTLNPGEIIVGDGASNAAAGVTGDLTMTNGDFQIAADAVTTTEIGSAGITDANKVLTTDASGNPQWELKTTVTSLPQDLDFTGNIITLSGDPTPTSIDLSAYDTDASDDVLLTTPATNNISGSFAAGFTINNDVIGSGNIIDGDIISADIQDGTIATTDIASGGIDQVLTTDAAGTVTWEPKGSLGGTQNLQQVLTQGNDAGALAITNLLDPVLAQDAATKAYVDANLNALPVTTDAQILVSNAGTLQGVDVTGDLSITNTGVTTIAGTAGDNIITAINGATTQTIEVPNLQPGADKGILVTDGATVNWLTEANPNKVFGTDLSNALVTRSVVLSTTGPVDNSGIRAAGTASDANLVSEAAVREAIDAVGVTTLQSAYDAPLGTEIVLDGVNDLEVKLNDASDFFTLDQTNVAVDITGNINVTPLAGGGTVELRGDGAGNPMGLFIWDGNNINFAGFSTPIALTNPYILTLPLDLPATDGQVLTSDIGGNLSWSTSGSSLISNPGTNNLFAGENVGTGGSDNAFFGFNAGNVDTGIRNSIFGAEAGSLKTAGNGNTVMGWSAGQNITGGLNTMIGAEAGNSSTSGANNVYLGYQAGLNSTVANNSVYIGSLAGQTNVDGNGNVAIGRLADFGSGSLSNAVSIGSNSLVTQSNSIVLGSINGLNGATANTFVGIGTTAPAQELDILGSNAGGVNGRVTNLDSQGFASWIAVNDVQGYAMGAQGSASATNPGDFIIYDNAATSSRFVLDETGNIAVGSTSPTVSFEIQDTDAILLPSGTTAQQPTGIAGYLRFNSETSSFEGYDGTNWGNLGAGGASSLQGAYDGGSDVTMTTGQNVNFTTSVTSGSIPLLTLDEANGRIGIGTNAPGNDLDMRSQDLTTPFQINLSNSDASRALSLYSGGPTVADTPYIFWNNGGSGEALRFVDFPGNVFTERMRIDATGNVGINNAAPASQLHVGGGNIEIDVDQSLLTIQPNFFLYQGKELREYSIGWYGDTESGGLAQGWFSAFPGFKFFTGNNLRMSIAENGNVGVGTTGVPTEKLDVAGSINVSVGSGLSIGNVQFVRGSTTADNVFVGGRAGNSLVTGSANVMVGTNTGANSDNVIGNTFVGNNAALFNTTGQGNAFFGGSAGDTNETGDNNTFIGTESGIVNITGSFNSFLGFRARPAVDGLTNANAIGANAVVGTSNTVRFGIDGTAIEFNGELRPGGPGTEGTAGQVLTSQGTGAAPQWQTIGGGGTLQLAYNGGNTITLDGTNDLIINFSDATPFVTFDQVDAAINLNGSLQIADFNVLVSDQPNANIFVGANAGVVNTGIRNAFFGVAAGAANTSGEDNTFIGRNAGTDNTTGLTNTYIGKDAGLLSTTGNGNVFVGYLAGGTNVTGVRNVILGRGADLGAGNIQDAIAIGAGAIVNNSQRMVLGRSDALAPDIEFYGALMPNNDAGLSGQVLTSAGPGNVPTWTNVSGSLVTNPGTNNLFGGTNAGVANTTGSNNAFYGAEAGATNATGQFNSFFGAFAGNANDGGGSNTFVGYNAGRNQVSGGDNVFVGRGAGDVDASGINNVYIGRDAGGVANGANNNVFIGRDAGAGTTSGGTNIFIGQDAGLANTTGFDNTIIGNQANVSSGNLSNAIAIGNGAIVSASNRMVLGATGTDIEFDGALLPAGVSGTVGQVLTSTGAGTPQWADLPGSSGWSLAGNAGTTAGTDFIGTTDVQDFVVKTNNIERFRVNSDGRVSINSVLDGTSTGSLLEIKSYGSGGRGNVILRGADGNVEDTPDIDFRSNDYTLQARIRTDASTGNSLIFAVRGTDQLTIDNTGVFDLAADADFSMAGVRFLSTDGGVNNTFLGLNAGVNTTTSGGNTFFGTNAGLNSNAQGNTFLGTFAGEGNTTGVGNTFVGRGTGQLNANSNYNTIMGYDAGNGASGALRNVLIGWAAGEFTQGSDNVFIGERAGRANTTGINNILIGGEAEVLSAGLSNAIAIGYGASVGASNTMILGNSALTSVRPGADNASSLGSPLTRWSTVYATNGTINTSDRREKENISGLPYGLSEILKLTPVQYNWINKDIDHKIHLGLIAQEVLEIIPEVVNVADDKKKSLGLAYTELIPVTIKAIQEQQEIIEQQQAEIAALKAELTKKDNEHNDRFELLEAKIDRLTELLISNSTTDNKSSVDQK